MTDMRRPDPVDLHALGTGRVDFVRSHDVWSASQHAAAEDALTRMEEADLDAVRVSFSDPNGISRSKTLSATAFRSALRNGLDCSQGPYFFDTGMDIVFNPFQPGGGIGIPAMTGAADFLLVPDPETFRVLPWVDRTGWVLADEYFKDGTPVPLSGRALLKRLIAELADQGLEYVAGLEVEWYLTRLVDPRLDTTMIGGFGSPGAPPHVAPVNLGYQFNIEQFNDELEPIVSVLRRALQQLGLPLRTTEHESGPGQLEFTFDPQQALDAADSMILFRTATKQLCARHGYHASFMSAPALDGFDTSGWHLHQSLFHSADGRNAFTGNGSEPISPLGRDYAGGLIRHAAATSAFAIPTVNGYRRLGDAFALSPDRATWSLDNRGTFLRLLGGPGDPATHLENRLGEPAANPYLYMAAQIVAGMDGVRRHIDPGPLTDNPHADDLPRLPADLGEAIAALEASALFRERLGDVFMRWFLQLKANEWARYQKAVADLPPGEAQARTTDWEQREYFRAF